MRAAVMYGAGDVRVEDRPDPKIHQPTDAVVRVLRAAICGSDLHPYHSMPPTDQGRPMGHEFLGVVEEVGSEVSGLKAGDLVVLVPTGMMPLVRVPARAAPGSWDRVRIHAHTDDRSDQSQPCNGSITLSPLGHLVQL